MQNKGCENGHRCEKTQDWHVQQENEPFTEKKKKLFLGSNPSISKGNHPPVGFMVYWLSSGSHSITPYVSIFTSLQFSLLGGPVFVAINCSKCWERLDHPSHESIPLESKKYTHEISQTCLWEKLNLARASSLEELGSKPTPTKAHWIKIIYIYYVTYLYTYIIYLYICTYIVHSTYIDKFLKSNQPKRNQGGTLKPEKQRLQLDTSWLLKVTSLASGCSIKELWIEPRRASGWNSIPETASEPWKPDTI